METRVVVTGMGAVTPLGCDVCATWKGMVEGRSGIGPITLFDARNMDTQIAGEVKGFDPLTYLDRKEVRRTDRFVHFAMAAALQAVESARLKIDASNAEDVGVLIGSGIGGITTLGEQFKVLFDKGPSRVNPFLIPMMITDMGAGQVSIRLGAKGPNFCTSSACASSADAIGEAYEIIRRGDAQAMIAGGSEAAITPIGVAAFSSARALSQRNETPEQASRPFDAERDGFVMSEGAAILILENLVWAERRGAPILAEVAGYGATADAFHITQPSEGGEGGARAMRRALQKAGLQPEEIDYINAHGTSTPLNDKFETMAIKTVFGDYAYKVPVSSTKSVTGHLLGAAGAVEALACIMALRSGVIPPTINLTTPDPECDLDYVPNIARRAKIATALSNSLGFGGHNSTLIFRSPQ